MTRISQFDYMLATTPDESAGPPYGADPAEPGADEAYAVAASMVREALRLAADVALDDAVNGGVLLGRMAGLSLAEIGGRLGMTKQAVHKRVLAISQRWPHLGEAIGGAAAPLDEEAVGTRVIVENIRKIERTRQEATRWMNKPN